MIFFPSSSLGYIWQTITTQQYAQIGLPLAPWLRAEHRDEAGAVITGGLCNSNFSFGFLIILPPLGLWIRPLRTVHIYRKLITKDTKEQRSICLKKVQLIFDNAGFKFKFWSFSKSDEPGIKNDNYTQNLKNNLSSDRQNTKSDVAFWCYSSNCNNVTSSS